jgi:arsenate reductase
VLTKNYAGEQGKVRSAGSELGDAVDPVVATVLAERGLSVSGYVPTRLTYDTVDSTDVVVTMGCGETSPVFPAKRSEDWQIDEKVRVLLAGLRIAAHREAPQAQSTSAG